MRGLDCFCVFYVSFFDYIVHKKYLYAFQGILCNFLRTLGVIKNPCKLSQLLPGGEGKQVGIQT